VVAVNDLTDSRTLAHLLKYDSSSALPGPVQARGEAALEVDGAELKVLAERDPADCRGAKLGVDVVIESTGSSPTRQRRQDWRRAPRRSHLGAATDPMRRCPGSELRRVYDRDAPRSSRTRPCTTNCLLRSPSAARLGRDRDGLMTTIHAYTADQRLQDCRTGLRRARRRDQPDPGLDGAAKAIAW